MLPQSVMMEPCTANVMLHAPLLNVIYPLHGLTAKRGGGGDVSS